jgi:hypothetical protein
MGTQPARTLQLRALGRDRLHGPTLGLKLRCFSNGTRSRYVFLHRTTPLATGPSWFASAIDPGCRLRAIRRRATRRAGTPTVRWRTGGPRRTALRWFRDPEARDRTRPNVRRPRPGRAALKRCCRRRGAGALRNFEHLGWQTFSPALLNGCDIGRGRGMPGLRRGADRAQSLRTLTHEIVDGRACRRGATLPLVGAGRSAKAPHGHKQRPPTPSLARVPALGTPTEACVDSRPPRGSLGVRRRTGAGSLAANTLQVPGTPLSS